MARRIRYSPNGLVLLGTEACNDLAVPLYSSQQHGNLPKHTLHRRDKALKLADATVEMIKLAPPAGARQAAFTIARKVVAHALDYDAGVLPCSMLLPHAGAIDDAVTRIAAATLDVEPHQLSPEQLTQLSLPTRCSGMQLDLPSRIVPLARAARLVEMGPQLRAAIASWCTTEVEPERFDGVDQAVADGLPGMLVQRGITALGGWGRPAASGEPSARDPFRPAVPEKHLLSAYLWHSAEACSFDLWCKLEDAQRVRMLSAGGPSAGTSFVAPLNTPGVHYTDRQWSEAVRWRLGMKIPMPTATCKNENLRGETCNELLDTNGDHAVTCGTGPLRTLRHDGLADIYADILEEVGALARRETFVPELSKRGKEAWLDVWGYGLIELPGILLDITVRHPRASRYMPAAARTHGFAAEQADIEKTEKYPASGGRSVLAVAHETWGRLGSGAEQLLAACAGVAARRAYRRGRLAGNCLGRWRAQLDAELHRNIAAQLAAAHVGLPGRRRRHAAPAGAADLEGRCPL